MRKINLIVLHHTATRRDVSVEDIRRAHLRRGFSDIGYHFVIDANGRVHPGREIARVGAHARGHNAHSLGIAVIGNFEKESPTPAQLHALSRLIAELLSKFPSARIVGHRDLCPTRCPGRHLYEAVLPYVREKEG